MKREDFVKFGNLMKGMCETYNRAPSREQTELYFRVLEDMPIESVVEGVTRLLRERVITSTFPVPGEIRAAIAGGVTAAISALDKAERAAERYGSYRSVQFDDPVIHMVIEAMGGWPKFCRPDDDQNWHWHQKEFIRMYEVFAKSNRQCSKQLTGLSERDNSASGMPYSGKLCIIGEGLNSTSWKHLEDKNANGMKRIESTVVMKELVES